MTNWNSVRHLNIGAEEDCVVQKMEALVSCA